MDKYKLMQQYVDDLNAASQAYYNGLTELMTDYEWDAMFDKLKALEEELGIVLPDSPTNNVSADNIAGNKEEHEFAALSLAKTKKVADLVKWAENKPIWLSWKLDGLTLVVTYDDGKLTKVVTRGDGHTGTNITHLAKAINGIKNKIDYKGHLVIRGEAVISYADFEAFRMISDEDYANPRNLASGSMTLKDVEEVKRRNITWIAFTLVHSDEFIESWGKQMDFLNALGFNTVEHKLIIEPDSENVQKGIDEFTLEVTNGTNPYPVDGLVICYDDVIYSQTGSVTGHHATKAGYAFKWQDEASESELEYIEWSPAASTITPVAVFKPVEIEGTTVKRASLCNISECYRLGIGGAGSKISVIKANKIIPKVIKVNEKVGEFVLPESCPVCGAKTIVNVSQASGTETLRCSNADCPAKQLRKYARFVSKAGCDIDGISEMTLARFISQGWIFNYGDIYRLVNHKEDIAKLEGFGEKSANNIETSINNRRSISDVKLLYALNIPLVGVDVAKKLLAAYSFEELMEIAIKQEDLEFFDHIDHIGPEKSTSFINWFKNEKNVNNLKDLLTEIKVERTNLKAEGSGMANLTFVVTGDVNVFKNRNELKAYIESQGGKVTGAVSKATNYLINNDLQSASSKNQKAKQLNIPIISEAQFIEMFKKD